MASSPATVAGVELPGQWPTTPEANEPFTGAPQVVARQHSHQSRRSAGSSSVEGRQHRRGTESSGRRRFDGSSRFASSFEEGPPCGTGLAFGSPNRGMLSFHPAITQTVGKVGRGTGERARGVGRRPQTKGQVSGKDGPDSTNHTASVRDHIARKDPRSRGSARSFEGTGQRDGNRTGRGTEEECQIALSAFSRFGHSRVASARVGRSARRTRGARQRSQHGDTDQSRELVGCKFQPFQPVGLTGDTLENATHEGVFVAQRVKLWDARAVRVGEAKNPGPEGITVDSISSTLWDSGAQFSVLNRASGLTGSASEWSRLYAMQFDLTMADSDQEGDAAPGATFWKMSQRIAPRPTFQKRLRLMWSSSALDAGCGQHDARVADNFMRQLAARVGAIPRDAQLPRCLRDQRWSPLNVPLLWSAAGEEETTPVLDWLTEATVSMQEMVVFYGREVNLGEAVRSGWTVRHANVAHRQP